MFRSPRSTYFPTQMNLGIPITISKLIPNREICIIQSRKARIVITKNR